MKAVVLLGLGADVRIPPQRDPRSGRVREEWLVREIDPGSARALELALQLTATRPGVEVTALHLGPPETEPWLRRALARGAGRAVRIWDDEAAGLHAAAKAVVLAAAVEAAGFDLVLTGAAGVIDAGGQLGVLLAAHLGVPCVTQVAEFAGPSTSQVGLSVQMTRALERGFRERVEVVLPAVVTVSALEAAEDASACRDVPAAALLAAQAAEITVWELSDLGVPRERVRRAEQVLRYGWPRIPDPRLRPLAAPDPALPAFDRILKLIAGSVQRREGRVVKKPADEVVEEIFRALRDEGWLDHLRAGRDGSAPKAGDASEAGHAS